LEKKKDGTGVGCVCESVNTFFGCWLQQEKQRFSSQDRNYRKKMKGWTLLTGWSREVGGKSFGFSFVLRAYEKNEILDMILVRPFQSI
jgi:hypothetical protein